MDKTKNVQFTHPFLPQKLEIEKVYNAYLVSTKKKEAELEFSSLNSTQLYSFSDLLKMPENRFWCYGKSPFFRFLPYSFYLTSFDQESKSFHFSFTKKRLSSFFSFKKGYFYKKEKNIQKGRFLSTSCHGYKFSVNGDLGKMKKKVKKRFSKWPFHLLQYLCAYGFLTALKRSFRLCAKKRIFKRRKRKLFSKTLSFYTRKNRYLQLVSRLKRNKKCLFQLLTKMKKEKGVVIKEKFLPPSIIIPIPKLLPIENPERRLTTRIRKKLFKNDERFKKGQISTTNVISKIKETRKRGKSRIEKEKVIPNEKKSRF